MGDYKSIYTFHNKSLFERLEEYQSILCTGKTVAASNIRTEWICDVELVIEPVGWQALWKISRTTCENYNIRYPTIVLVEVLGMDFPMLDAIVKITAVQDDIHLPEKHEVPLIELYPTIDQKNDSLDIAGTAHCIDRLRFFYNHIWMPWDEEEDDDVDWVEQHLEPRIRLFFDMNNGAINKETSEIIGSLISEGKELQRKISTYEALLPEDLHEGESISEDLAEKTCALMKLHFRLQQIKAEMDLLENPSLRELLGKNRTCNKRKKSNENTDNIYYFVWLGGVVKELCELSNRIQTMLPLNSSIKICGCLEDALDTFEEGDTVLLGSGQYQIKRSTELPEKGAIIGISNAENTVLSRIESNISSILLDLSGTEVLLKNICIDLGIVQAGLVVRKDCTVIITGCRIRISNNVSHNSKWGAVVMPGGKLILENTIFEGLGTAVVVYATGEVIMTKCSFQNCHDAVQLYDNANFTATKCSFDSIQHGYAIIMETEKVDYVKDVEVGSMSFNEISLNECTFYNNDKCIMLKPKDTTTITQKQVCALSEGQNSEEKTVEP